MASTLGGTAKLCPPTPPLQLKRKCFSPPDAAASSARPHPEHLTQSLVWSPGTGSLEEVIDRAKSVYRVYSDSAGDKSLVCLGSTKSNPVVELVVASAFGCEPFEVQTNVGDPRYCCCPFYLRFRDSDPHPMSCFGGLNERQPPFECWNLLQKKKKKNYAKIAKKKKKKKREEEEEEAE